MPASAPGGANTFVRILSALVLAPLAIGTAWYGGLPFALFWLIAGGAVLYEWTAIVWPSRDLGGASKLLWLSGGWIYAGLMSLAPAMLRGSPLLGMEAILFLFAIVWTTDVLGYFGGRALGGPKLAPSISPSKTWSGAACGTVGAGIAAFVTAWLIGSPHLVVLPIVGMALSVIAQIGDLGESAFKRKFHTKDASHLIPGHGGVMDRLDGFWAAAVIAVGIGIVRGGFADPARGLLIW